MNDAISRCLITINAPPALEDSIADWLLCRDPDQGFTSSRADGHGSAHERFSITEQVRGRQHRVEFRLILDLASVDDLASDLTGEFAGADVFYFVTPVLLTAHLLEKSA